MSDSLTEILPDLWTALGQTALMLGVSLGAAVLLGAPLGALVLLTDQGQAWERRWLFRIFRWRANPRPFWIRSKSAIGNWWIKP